MTLFDSDSQFREKAAICRIFELLPLYAPLAEGCIFRWFALNIPMDLGTGGRFTSDIDIVARLNLFPSSGPDIYKTWEVKVSLLCKDGTARSLKAGKTRSTINQLRAYRDFGSPEVSLLDVYICEAGFMNSNAFPPQPVRDAIETKLPCLKKNGFGYQVLPFEHQKDGDIDVGLMAYTNPTRYGFPTTNFKLVPATRAQPVEGFSRLVDRLNDRYQRDLNRLPTGKGFVAILFCRKCRQLGLTSMKVANLCPHCGMDLRLQ